jgi:DNA-binding GntR family transcriptional regulator
MATDALKRVKGRMQRGGHARSQRRLRVEAMPAARTRAESLRLKLEEEILSRRMLPGQKLDEEELAARFGLSRTPVREALKALTSTGLIELRAHQGAYVAKLTPRSIIEMVEFMSMLEVNCARLAARRHSAADRNAIQQAQNHCERAVRAADPRAFYAANIAFHEAIYRASRNEFLAGQAQALRQRLEPYRRQIVFHHGLIERSVREHGDIVDAILAMKEEQAGIAMRRHLGALQDSIASMVESLSGEQEASKRSAG